MGVFYGRLGYNADRVEATARRQRDATVQWGSSRTGTLEELRQLKLGRLEAARKFTVGTRTTNDGLVGRILSVAQDTGLLNVRVGRRTTTWCPLHLLAQRQQ
jgi:hypothetical protein